MIKQVKCPFCKNIKQINHNNPYQIEAYCGKCKKSFDIQANTIRKG